MERSSGGEGAAVRLPHPGPGWRRWGGRAAFATLDQGLFAGSNFLVNVALARWLSPEAYGRFTVAYAVAALLGTAHTTLLTTPMLVYGAHKYAGTFRGYLGVLLRLHWAVTGAMSVGLLAAAGVLHGEGARVLAQTFLGLAVAIPCVLLLWLVRSAFYVQSQPRPAAAASAAYFVLLAAGLYVVYRAGRLSPASGMMLMGAASAIAAAAFLPLLRARGRPADAPAGDGGGASVTLAGVMLDHLRFARWALGSDIAAWAGSNAQYLVLFAAGSLPLVAAIRILDTMLLPYHHAQAALARLLLPVFGRAGTSSARLRSLFVRVAAGFGAASAVAYALTALAGPTVVGLVYGSRYAPYGVLLGWYALMLLPETLEEAGYTLFRATVRMHLILVYRVMFSAAVLAAIWLGAPHGLRGVVLARVAVSFVCSVPVLCSAAAVCGAARPAAWRGPAGLAMREAG